jgi:hypothetical protein
MPDAFVGCREILDAFRKLEQAKSVRDRASVLAHTFGHELLGQVELEGHSFVGARLVDRVEIFPLQVLDKRKLQHFLA